MFIIFTWITDGPFKGPLQSRIETFKMTAMKNKLLFRVFFSPYIFHIKKFLKAHQVFLPGLRNYGSYANMLFI